MSKHWIINDSYFGKIKDLTFLGESIKHFINDVVYKHPNWDILLRNLSDIYVLVASFANQKLLKDGEKSWKEIMKKDEYDILEKNNNFVVSYMLVKEENQNTHYIELFDTIIRNNNLGRVMINKYERDKYNVNLVPQYIIPSSAKYWGKVLGLYNKEDIEEYIKYSELDSNDLRWKHLYDLCDNQDEDIEEWTLDDFDPIDNFEDSSDDETIKKIVKKKVKNLLKV